MVIQDDLVGLGSKVTELASGFGLQNQTTLYLRQVITGKLSEFNYSNSIYHNLS
ncbi:UNKNOWN [Stylonychia lemnae]|uniref:Uncharacterized protein n=1 Tax=Stylonychia lemnae TaxID=5949 RepID=A0A077ZVN0_STYLE|nr:UNKNOWN [Stylonychia lemnae]|eukprot:CDW73929.1 UNKNOWN [Stylonychia lemnae]